MLQLENIAENPIFFLFYAKLFDLPQTNTESTDGGYLT